jgi:hypothetical protein
MGSGSERKRRRTNHRDTEAQRRQKRERVLEKHFFSAFSASLCLCG